MPPPEKVILNPSYDMEKSETKRSWTLKLPNRPALMEGGRTEPCKPGHRLGEAAVLGNEQVIMGVLQVERVEEKLHSWGVLDKISAVSHKQNLSFNLTPTEKPSEGT